MAPSIFYPYNLIPDFNRSHSLLLMPALRSILKHSFFIRVFHWEYWNSSIVYFPLYPYWLWLSIKSRSLFFLSAANPAIKNGGFIMESKNDVYGLMPQSLFPLSVYCNPGIDTNTAIRLLNDKGLSFPIIAKPDYGERGLGVKKIYNAPDLEHYIKIMQVPFLLQSFIPYKHEAGIFYIKLPNAEKGFVSGIVNKITPHVIGDGKSSIEALAVKVDRYRLQWKEIKLLGAGFLNRIPEKGECVELIPYGNHSRGALFLDESHLISEQLNDRINKICEQIPGFYYGRLDIKYENWESFLSGKRFSIIELNGSGSEPTHIYDPRHSIFFAWREIIKHWKWLYSISTWNHTKGCPYLTFRKGRSEKRAFKAIEAKLDLVRF